MSRWAKSAALEIAESIGWPYDEAEQSEWAEIIDHRAKVHGMVYGPDIHGEWISIASRLPVDDVRVLVKTKHGHIDIATLDYDAKEPWRDDYGRPIYPVVEWMKLPDEDG